MLNNQNKDFFTAGELANIYGISKQALLYYDKVKLLSPEMIAQNGYRHYYIQQYLDLELIVNLRSLEFSIAEIKEYLDNRSKDKLIEMLNNRKSDCEKIIKTNQQICNAITTILNDTESTLDVPLERITLNWKQESLLRLTPLQKEDSAIDRIVKFAKHTQATFHNDHLIKKRCGWIIDTANFNNDDKYYTSKAFFSIVPNSPGHKKIVKKILPKGMYLEIFFQGSYFQNAKRIREKINKFINANDLYIAGDVYVLPIDNHWFSKNSDEYITKIFMHVKEK